MATGSLTIGRFDYTVYVRPGGTLVRWMLLLSLSQYTFASLYDPPPIFISPSSLWGNCLDGHLERHVNEDESTIYVGGTYECPSSDDVRASGSRPTQCDASEAAITNILHDLELVFKTHSTRL